MPKYAEILVNSRLYTYAIPADLADQAEVGKELEVTLRGKRRQGYLVKFVPQPEFATLDILQISDSKSAFSQQQVELAEWISDYYKCFRETALKLILPK